MNRLAQLKLLVWKNLKIQKKHKLGTAFEIGLPICMVIILVIIRHYINSEEQCTSELLVTAKPNYTHSSALNLFTFTVYS